jgi:hypothetical protein
MKKQKLPPGWTEERVRKVIEHYENQTEEEQAAEIEAEFAADNVTWVAVPTELVPKVVQLIKGQPRSRKKNRRSSKSRRQNRIKNTQAK